MKIKYRDVKKNIDKNIPIETDYFISDLILDADGINIYSLLTINEDVDTYYIKGFDLNEVVDYLNDLYERCRDFIKDNYLFNIPNGFLAVIYNYYKDNKNKKHQNLYIWNLIENVYLFITKSKMTELDKNDKDKLINWLNEMLNHNEKYDKIYYKYEKGESFL